MARRQLETPLKIFYHLKARRDRYEDNEVMGQRMQEFRTFAALLTYFEWKYRQERSCLHAVHVHRFV
jgi:hypothetical protein